MSQVVVTRDAYNQLRARARVQEACILRDQAFVKWQANGTVGLKLISRAVAVFLSPVAIVWVIMIASLSGVLSALAQFFRICGLMLPKSKNSTLKT